MKIDYINNVAYPASFVRFYNTLVNRGKAKKHFLFTFDGRWITANYGDDTEHIICEYCPYASPETLYNELLDYCLIPRIKRE